MNISTHLNPARILFLLKREGFRRWKDFLITVSAFCGFFLLSMIVGAKTGSLETTVHYSSFGSMLFIYGAIFTSFIFREAHRKSGIHNWLMLPASTIEKLVTKLIVSSVVFAVAALIVYSVFSLIAGLVVRFALDSYYPAFNPFDSVVWRMIGHYLILQSIFLLGAVWFKKNNLIKTVISLVLFSIVLMIVVSLVTWLVFNDYFWAMAETNFSANIDFSGPLYPGRLEALGEGAVLFIKIMYFGLLAPLCWFGSWLKLRELEVCDGV